MWVLAHFARCRVRLFCALYDAIFAAAGAKGGWKREPRVGADSRVCPPCTNRRETADTRADTGVCPYMWETPRRGSIS
jgi:hypothetical protein